MKTIRSLSIGLLAVMAGAGGAAAAAKIPADAVEKIRAAAPEKARVAPAGKRKILVFSLCRGFVHEAVPYGAAMLRVLGEKTGAFEVVETDDPGAFSARSLKRFDAVVFNNTTGELFLPAGFAGMSERKKKRALKRDAELKESLLEFVRAGKGVVGIHAATDTFYEWPEFGIMMGGYFNGHPWNEEVGVAVDDPGHPLCAAFGGKGFAIADEIYTFKAPYSRENLKVLLRIDREKTPEKGNRADDDYAISWVREYGKGRVFYCSLGHRNEVFWNPLVLQFYLDGIQYALGDLKADASPSGMTGPVDLWMGEYAGTFTAGNGRKTKAEAKVVPAGAGSYQVSLRAGEETVELEGRMNGRKLALSRQTFDGYILDWMVSGPYRKQGKDGKALFGVAFAPEEAGDGEVEWREIGEKDPSRPWLVDLGKAVGGGDAVAYIKARVKSDREQKAELLIGSDDGVKAWLNGRQVHANDVMRGVKPGEDRVAVNLEKGWNTLMLKINQGGGDWGACAKLEPLGGGSLPGLTSAEDGEGKWTGEITTAALSAKLVGGAGGSFELKRVERSSDTVGARPPRGAVVLVPLTEGPPSLDEWVNDRWQALDGGVMQCGKGDNRTRREFGDVVLHLEFMIPYEPEGRGQGRGNSGVYLQDRYEVQVLDSFGLPPMDNGCGGIYQVAVPLVNASLPPLKWQTYDIDFRAPRLDGDGKIRENARATVRHNGILIHDDVEIPGPTGGAASMEPARRAPLRLQDHGHPVRYRNVWVVEK